MNNDLSLKCKLKRYWDYAKERQDVSVFHLYLGEWQFNFSYLENMKAKNGFFKNISSIVILGNRFVEQEMKEVLQQAKDLGFCKHFTIKQHLYPKLAVEIKVVTSLSVVFTATTVI